MSIAQQVGEGSWFSAGIPHLEALVDVLPSMVWAATVGQGIDFVSHRWTEFTGRSAAELRGFGYIDLVHEDDVASLEQHSRAASSGEVQVIRFRIRRHDGQMRWVEARHEYFQGDDGVMRAVGATTDITEQVVAEDQLRSMSEQLSATLELGKLGGFVWEIGPDGIGLGATAQGSLHEILGANSEQLANEGGMAVFGPRIHPDDYDSVLAAYARALDPKNGEYRIEHRLLGFDDPAEVRWLSILGRMAFNDEGQAVEMVGVIQDITTRRHEEHARLQLQKLEATATLAGGVAHDFGNLVGAILSAARGGQIEAAAGKDTTETFEDIATAARHAAALVERLLAFARPQAPSRERLDLEALVSELIRLVRPSLPRRIKLECDVQGNVGEVFGDPAQVHQVLLNLISNAGQAIGPASGTITIQLDSIETDQGPAARLRVVDTGVGMTKVVAERVFDPFFTTRSDEGGTGLGLAAVQTVVAGHHGTIDVDSTVGRGSTFTVLLPANGARRVGGPIV